MASNTMAKDYSADVVNGGETLETHSVFGLIKLFLHKVHDSTIILRCKLILGTVEISHCSNVVVKIEREATIATLQADLCENIIVEFHDAPSGKNTAIAGHQPTLYWVMMRMIISQRWGNGSRKCHCRGNAVVTCVIERRKKLSGTAS